MEDRDRGYSSLMELIQDLKEERIHVAIGVLDGSGGEVALDDNGLTVAGLATVHEFGAEIDHPGGTPYVVVGGRARFVKKDSPEGKKAISAGRVTGPHRIRIPERAPIRKTLDAEKERINTAAKRLLTAVVDRKISQRRALGQLGEFISSQIRRTIQRGIRPPNAPGTIRKKRSSKPLIDTGFLVRSYTYQVRTGKKGG